MIDHVATLADLVRRPSVNPMGRTLTGPEYLEGRVSEYLVQRFSTAGLAWARQNVAPGRDNVLAVLDATEPDSPTVLWDAHQDTVPVDGMTIAPFTPVLRDGRLCGRGSCDVKGGMAAMLVALERLRHEPRRGVRIVFAATVNEEFGFSGAKAVARLWQVPCESCSSADRPAAELLAGRPLAAVVAEPTELNLVATHKGAVRWRLVAHGRACHSAFPEDGANAIYPAARAALAMERLAAELGSRSPDHPCGPPTLSIGTIHGGIGVNLVPDRVVLEIDRRLLPGESAEAARQEVIDAVATAVGPEASAAIEHEPPFLSSDGLPKEVDGRTAAMLAAAATRCGHKTRVLAARYGTNASIYAAADVPSVVFGPGSIAQAHTVDEWIELDQVALAAAILTDTVAAAAV
ncbi:MAG: M20/M25/M40 family metallo-hydrolase [Planctomycetota bacterium]|nr:M20/M25/M40 family metallo-hydrolase [Planctomycetota bacterium]MDA0969052.1 M20/M25/M40 family metallo-hydrolase [Planctomycetota bacterium]